MKLLLHLNFAIPFALLNAANRITPELRLELKSFSQKSDSPYNMKNSFIWIEEKKTHFDYFSCINSLPG